VFLFVATRSADPMAFPITFAAAVLVPLANGWSLVPQFRTKVIATLAGFVVPVVAAVAWLWR